MTTRAKWILQYSNVINVVSALFSVAERKMNGKMSGAKRHIKAHSITEELSRRISLYEFWFFKFNYSYFCYW